MKKRDFFSKMRKQIVAIFFDVTYLYKNFIHWNISKVIISIWTFLLAFLLTAPVFLCAIILGFIDPINWSEILSFVATGNDISYNFIGIIAQNMYWLIAMVFVLLCGTMVFFLASSYSLVLQANLSFYYLKEKRLKYKKNLYFSRPHIIIFLSILCWNIMYILAPILIWVGVVFFLYLFFNIGFIGFNTLSILLAIVSVIGILSLIYLLYRIVFGYILLAKDAKKKKLLSARTYVRESIKITKGNSFWKFLFIFLVYIAVFIPYIKIDSYLEVESIYLKDTIIYNSGLLENIEPDQIKYYEYITAEYAHLSDDTILSKIQSFYILRVILFFFAYFVFEGLFVYILTSFYTRVLSKK